MQSSQINWISFGVLSLFGLGYYYRKCSEQQKESRKKIEEFQAVYGESEKNRFSSLNQVIKGENSQTQLKEKNVCFVNLKPTYSPDTFKLFERERSVYAPNSRYKPNDVLQHQMGGQFTVKTLNQEEILCKLNDFNLSAALLKEQQKKVHIFKGYNDLEPIVKSVTATLNPTMPIAIYGKLYYDSHRLSWAIQPFFLTDSLNLKSVVQNFYKEKIQTNNLTKFAILMGGMILTYFVIISPLQSWWIRRKALHREGVLLEGNDTDFFQKKDHIIVKEESLLNCQICKVKNVEIVYECGHLAICLGCHQINQHKQCPLCKKVSKKFMKIFMA